LDESKSCKLKLYEDFINLKNENLNLKKNEKKFKFSEDTLPNSNVNSDNNNNDNGEDWIIILFNKYLNYANCLYKLSKL